MGKRVKKIDVYAKPKRVLFLFSLIIRTFSHFARKKEKAKIVRLGEIPKPPYLMIANHSSFMDIYAGLGAIGWHRSYWVCAIEEFIDKFFVCTHSGIIPRRRFVNDPKCSLMMMDILKKRKKILVIFPEARYSFDGKPERIDKGLAKLAKACKVPIVFLDCHGHYLRDPQWSDHAVREVPLLAEMRCLIDREQIQDWSVEAIDREIEKAFNGDEERYQLDNHFLISYPNRAVGLERILYKCPHCGTEFEMSSSGDALRCDHCHAEYRLNEDGTLSRLDGEGKFNRISQWYEWEKECVRQEVNAGEYHFEDDVRVEHLEGVGVGFSVLPGHYKLVHYSDGEMIIKGDDGLMLRREPLQSYAIHIDYGYHDKGACVDFSIPGETYFVYPLNKAKALTKIHFAVETIFDKLKGEIAE